MSLSKPLDHRDGGLKRDGEAVDGFRVGCLVAEEALKVSLRPSVGTTGLTTRLLGQTVKMNLDGYRNQQYVKVHEAERELAVRIAKRVRVEINRLGFEMKDAVVPSKDGKPGEEHDMVLEMVDVPDEGMVMKKVSGELTCRRMRSKAGLDVVREKLQKERVDEKSWWQREASTGQWEGRLVVLCNFPTGASGSFDSYADYTPVGDKPRGVLNWPYARRSFKRKADVMRLPDPPPAPPPVGRLRRPKQGQRLCVAARLFVAARILTLSCNSGSGRAGRWRPSRLSSRQRKLTPTTSRGATSVGLQTCQMALQIGRQGSG